MKRSATALLAIIAVAGLGGNAASKPSSDRGYSYYEIGNTKAPRPASPERALLLVGGGDWNPDAFRWFAAKTGHGHLVVIAAYGGAEDGEEFYRNVGGFTSVQTLVFRDRKASYDARVRKVLREADGIFIAGGDQSKYVRFWKGTPVEDAINSEIARGRPVGGTSAGLAVLGAYAYGAMDGGSVDSPTALKDPLGPAVTMVRDFLRMPYLQHVVTDTHFSARNRLGRSVAFLAKVRTRWDPKAIGLAIDESSALCVDSRGVGRFFTSKKGEAWLIRPTSAPKATTGKPLDWPSIEITRFGPKGSIDLKTMRVENPSSITTISVNHGRLKGI
jgi:beta-aspartyl-peptidase (threonine type)